MPTLRELTNPVYNKRIIMFHYNGLSGQDCIEKPAACPPQFHHYYDYVSDNDDYTFSSTVSIEDRESSCVTQRMSTYNENTLVGLQNFVTPNNWKEAGRRKAIRDAERLNQYYAIKDYVDSCTITQGRDINFVTNDWWGVGELIRLTQDHNTARALGDSYVAPTPAPTYDNDITATPTLFPTFFPTSEPETFPPTVSFKPSFSPTVAPTGRPDLCTEFNDDCRGCKNNNDECLWCISSNICYNRFVFENIFDLDDEVIPCAGEDILNSFDTTCKAPSRPQASVFDDDFVISDSNDSNETSVDDEVEEMSASPTKQPAEPPTLPPVFVPLSPPTAVESTSNVFNNWFGGATDSGTPLLTIVTSAATVLLSMVLLLLDV